MPYPACSCKLELVRIEDCTFRPDWDEVVVEHRLTVSINGTPFTSFSCSPAHLEELVAGALLVRGAIRTRSDLLYLEISEDGSFAQVSIAEHPSTAPLLPAAHVQISPEDIYEIMTRNLTSSSLFQRTGGVHSVALFHGREELVIREDMARHNAVDKAVGYALLQNIPLDTAALVVSGRISSDMMEKACAAGLPLVFSKGAPTDQAIRLAQDHDVTLAGFVRNRRMNVYTHPERIGTYRPIE